MPRTLPRHPIVAAQFVALLFVALVLAGCGSTTRGAVGGGEQAGAGQTTPGQFGDEQNQLGGEQNQSRSEQNQSGGGQDRGERKIGWVPPGPGTGSFNRVNPDKDDDWHKAFDERDCDAIAALGPQRGQPQLYTGLGAACRAALGDDSQSWPAAKAALQDIASPRGCLDQSALRLLRDLVTAHQQAPRATIRIVDAPGGTSCAVSSPPASPTPVPETEKSDSSGDPATPDAPSSSTG